jgi:chaperone modulatory protein CbpM
MNPQTIQPPHSAPAASVSLVQLSELAQVSPADLLELMDYGVLVPQPSAAGVESFSARDLTALQQAQHLREDLVLDTHAFALALMLSGRIVDQQVQMQAMKTELRALDAQLRALRAGASIV